MEDNFKLRVDKIFGSLSSSPSPSPSLSLSSLWSLTDEEIEKREWNRDRGSPDEEPTPYPPNHDGFFANQVPQQMMSQNKSLDFGKELENDIGELDDNDEDDVVEDAPGSSKQSVKPDDHNDEEWEIRSSVGLDCTLDYEEEEDEYDKVAVGKEKHGDRIYMHDINDYGICSNTYNELPSSFKDRIRDPRANHMAAKIRLKEDAEAAGSFDSLRVSDKTVPAVVGVQVNTSENGVNLKSILKRKQGQVDSKLQKRVRFNPECKDDCGEELEGAKEVEMETCPTEEASMIAEEVSVLPFDNSGVPDYIRNPSKYTCYTFDSSSEFDEESNCKAYMDFLNLIKRSNTMESQPGDASVSLPKSVAFTPKKKIGDATTLKSSTEFKRNQEDIGKECMQKKRLPIRIAASDVEGSEVCAMEEDEPETVADRSNSSWRTGRKYRTKARLELDESIT